MTEMAGLYRNGKLGKGKRSPWTERFRAEIKLDLHVIFKKKERKGGGRNP